MVAVLLLHQTRQRQRRLHPHRQQQQVLSQVDLAAAQLDAAWRRCRCCY